MKYYLKIHPTDTVAVALTPLKKGSVLPINDNTTITLTEDIPQGHKFALTDLAEGSSIIKYGNQQFFTVKSSAAEANGFFCGNGMQSIRSWYQLCNVCPCT